MPSLHMFCVQVHFQRHRAGLICFRAMITNAAVTITHIKLSSLNTGSIATSLCNCQYNAITLPFFVAVFFNIVTTTIRQSPYSTIAHVTTTAALM